MRLRFMRTTSSDHPELPFQAGQIINVPRLTAEMRQWVKDGIVVALADEPEAAVLGEPAEVAMVGRSRGRGSR